MKDAHIIGGLICLVSLASGYYLNRPSVSINRTIGELSVLEKGLLICITFGYPGIIIGLLPSIFYKEGYYFLEDLLVTFVLAIFSYVLGWFGTKLGDLGKLG